jgi:hypothetical protein
MINATKPHEEGETTAKTTDEVVKMNFKFKKDQAEIITQAIQKAKGELQTQYDTVAVENICAGYLGGTIIASQKPSMEEMIKMFDFNELMNKIADLNPEWDIVVQPATAAEAVTS